MTDSNQQPCPHLEPCPWCNCAIQVTWRKWNPRASCKTVGCFGSRMTVVNLDDHFDVAAWNRRATQASDQMELLREIYDAVVQGAIPSDDDIWWDRARAVLASARHHQQT